MRKELDLSTEQSTMDELAEAIDPRILDPIWRLNNLYKITDKEGNLTTFKPNVFQQDILNNFHCRMVVAKARQLGISTFMAILALDQCLFNQYYSAAITADKKENADTLFSRFEFAWEQLDPRIKKILGFKTVTDSKTMMKFSNGSSAKIGITIHSGTYQLLHISEFGPLCKASAEKASTLIKSALPTVPAGKGIIVIESTAEGEGNQFEDIAKSAKEETERAAQEGRSLFTNEWKLFFFPWFTNPEYQFDNSVVLDKETGKAKLSTADLEYRRKTLEETGYELTDGQLLFYSDMRRRLGPDDILTQYPATFEDAFKASGERYFPTHLIDQLINSDVMSPDPKFSARSMRIENAVERGDHSESPDLLVFKPWIPGHFYGIGADVSAGVAKDSSSAVVIDFTTREVVATYKNNRISPEDFAYELKKFAIQYGSCLVAPEVNLMGHTTCVVLNQIYPNVYYHVLQGYADDKQTERIGFLTNANTKNKFLLDLNSIIQDPEDRLKIRDKAILDEMRAYKKEDAFHRSETVNTVRLKTRHYDLLIATAICWQLRDYVSDGGTFSPEQERRIHSNREAVRNGSRKFH
jgi:hypothetical protein